MSSDTDAWNMEGVIVISLNEHPPEHTIQKILDVDTLPFPLIEKDGIKGYEWKINTKYYSASVNLYSIQEKRDFDSEFCDTIRATVFCFNGKEVSNFEDVLSWMPLLKNIASEVQLLVCDNCDGDETYKKKILNWCVENEYELIELNPSEEIDDEDDCLFAKSKGYGRVTEALQSHMWSDLVMKRDTTQQNHLATENEIKSNSSASSCISQKSGDNSKKITVDDEELMLEEQWLQKVFEGDDPNGESFEALFSKFASMKEKASNLSGEERKKYAEKVAVAFWKAMGGAEDEIEGLDDE